MARNMWRNGHSLSNRQTTHICDLNQGLCSVVVMEFYGIKPMWGEQHC